ncbi:hypothetical protein F5884DRAFT_905619 [Xylogone sp. PMI_703]|nr:hypothetical protein F5884DRAFT_905619 [Xylogone sp. PMI_703]
MAGPETEPIAVIGIASRFADDAIDPQRLWRYLVQGRSAMRPFPPEKLNADSHYHPNPDRGGMFYTKGGNFLAEDISRFDAAFFNFTKNEVLCMDPQQRLLLENVYEGLENAGIPLDQCISSDTSVYVGSFADDYRLILDSDFEQWVKYKGTGAAKSILANRISWFYDFSGASVTLDTACSSGLVAVHLACQNLRSGDSKMAIASAANLITHPYIVNDLSKLGALSPDGLSYTFDERANGYSRGEGIGTVILKRLSDAIRDGNTIRGLIRATGCNQDGKTQGIFVPSMEAQKRLIRKTYQQAGLDLKSTAYVEAHGTGTAVGDPIEVEAIATTFMDRPRDSPLYIGAVKTSLGHTEGAAGILSLIKTLMIVEEGIIPPNLNFKKVNPRIRQDEWNVAFPLEAIPWPKAGPRIASANSFGFGGTNAHVVISDAYSYLTAHKLNGLHRTSINIPSLADIKRLTLGTLSNGSHTNGSHTNGTNGTNGTLAQRQTPFTFVFSTFDKGGIQRMAERYIDNIKSQHATIIGHSAEQDFLNDLAYTLACRRSIFSWRATCRASTIESLIEQIQTLKAVQFRGQTPALAFVFTGQGAQWLGMGKSLISFPIFRKSLEDATEYTSKMLGSEWSLIDAILGEGSYDMNKPSLAQPLCTALQVAAVELLASWNVFPQSVVGHSSGEIAAAYAAGHLGRKMAWKIAYYRGVVSENVSQRGAMMAVGLREEDLQPYVEKVVHEGTVLSIACFNSASNLTISGDEDAIDSLKTLLDSDKVFARKLKVSNAYHSKHMETVAEEYHRLMEAIHDVDKLDVKQPVTMVSSVTGEEIQSKVVETASYWVKNLTSPVLFDKALLALMSGTSITIQEILEIGPHSALQSAIRDVLSAGDISGVNYSRIMARNDTLSDILLETAADLWERGYPINLNSVNEGLSSKPGQLLTSLPSYSFNHDTEYWKESRLSRDYRFRAHPRMDLIGAPIPDWNPHEPKWRQIFRISEIPWLVDHKVTDNVVYPGVGYLIMALEASKQLANPNKRLTGFRFRDLTIQTALIIPDNADGIETVLSMNPVSETFKSKSKVWYEFHVYSYDEIQKEWRVHCRGEVSTEYEKHSDVPIEDDRNSNLSTKQINLKEGLALCQRPFDSVRHYEKSARNGIQYGPTFRTLTDVKLGPLGQKRGIATGIVSITDLASVMPNEFFYPHTVQPATLDCMLQMVYPAVLDFKGAEVVDEPLVPTLFKEVWISAEIANAPGHRFRCTSQVEKIGSSDYRTNVSVWDKESSSIMVQFTDVEVTHIDVSTVQTTRELCHNVRWKCDADFATTSFFESKNLPEINDIVTTIFRKLQVATSLLIQDAVKELDFTDEAFEYLPHHQLYINWLKAKDKVIKDGQTLLFDQAAFNQCNSDPEFRMAFLKETSESGPNGEFIVKIGTQITSVLRQEVDPLYLMFGEDDGQLLDRVYREEFELGHIPIHFKSYLDLLSHKSGNLKFLEIGAGTGGTTLPILQTMCPPEDADSWTIHEYAYTDISPGFFEKAALKFKSWEGIIKFKTLDLEKDPGTQGFAQEDKYDVIVAGNVIHATSSIQSTLRRLHGLLNPGGKLIMHEIVQPEAMFTSLWVGLLPGWWLATEEYRKSGPLLKEQQWDSVLRESGFNGTEILLRDSSSESHISSIIISTAVDETGTRDSPTSVISPVYVVDTSIKTASESSASSLSKTLQKEYSLDNCQAVNFKELSGLSLETATCIILVDGHSSFLLNLDKNGFEKLLHLLNNCVRILWVTKGTDNPTFAMVKGVMRTTKWEKHTTQTNIVTLDIDTAGAATSGWSEYHAIMSKVFAHQFLNSTGTKSAEYEFRDGIMYTSRIYRHQEANTFMSSVLDDSPRITMRAWEEDPSRPLKLYSDMPGDLDSLRFMDDPAAIDPLGDLEVEIEVKAAGLNFRDVMIGMGEIAHDCFGFEGAGIVRSTGSKVDRFHPGDRVAVITGTSKMGCIQRFFRTPQDTMVKIPDTMSFEDAASVPCNFVTVLYSLRDLGRLSKGESILIHAGAGGTGQVAIQYANMVGAEVFATVSTVEKKRLLMDNYGVKEDHIFSSRNTDFAASILRATGGRGVDVVLNSLSGEALRRSWDCIAPLGRFIEMGKKDIAENGRLQMRPFDQNTTFASVDISILVARDPARVGRLLAETLQLVGGGAMRPPTPLTVYSYGEVTTAFRQLQNGKGMGKIVLVPSEDDIVPVRSPRATPHRFEADATYVLSGGFGGLGRSIARWMVSRGARNLVFMSRSGATRKPAEKLVRELESRGCRVIAEPCDVSSEESMRKLLNSCKALPPIKGCIQAAMQLKDMTLGTMTFEDYRQVIMPKVAGTWNLHNLLPKDLDFFIMLSSVSGIVGNRGQANYNAGNTFQDELARFRVKQGLKATAIDLGSLTAVGYLSENWVDTMQLTPMLNLLSMSMLEVSEEELIAILEFYMNPQSAPAITSAKSIDEEGLFGCAVGLHTAGTLQDAGKDIPPYMESALWAKIRTIPPLRALLMSGDGDNKHSTQSLMQRLGSAPDIAAATEIVLDSIRDKLSSMISIPAEDIDVSKALSSYGVDSLVAIEFRTWVMKDLGAEVPLLELLGSSPISGLASRITSQSRHVRL